MPTPLALLLLALTPAPISTLPPPTGPPPTGAVRFATFNVQELSREKLDRIDVDGRGIDPQLRAAAAVIQSVRPDVLLLNEIDHDTDRVNARLFRTRYLAVPQAGCEPIDLPHVFFEPVNTGVPSGFDLNRDGNPGGPDDALGFGRYPGQYGMAVLSRFPIDMDRVRTFRTFRWAALPGNVLPDGRDGRPAWYPPAVAAVLPLSSKSHWDVPIDTPIGSVHLLASHPTPPVFDGPEDRNGRRNRDEIQFWANYLTGGDTAAALTDDTGTPGGLPDGAAFVVAGDLNSDPDRGERFDGMAAVRALLDHPRIHDPRPTNPAAVAAHPKAPPEQAVARTGDFGRLDYVLPSRNLTPVGSGVFWAAPAAAASDHRLVWVDLRREAAAMK